MAHFPFRWSETWRVLAYTAALALAFIGLGRLELGLLSTFGAGDALALTSSADEPALARAALDVEQRSLACRASSWRRFGSATTSASRAS